MSWMRTYTGRKFYPTEPDGNEIDIRDIAHALSNLCRFAGHCKDFYSVAQHCVLVEKILGEGGYNKRTRLQGLLHDSTEAYLVDIPRPVKTQDFMKGYRTREGRLEEVIAKKFGMECLCIPEVKEADWDALATEARDLMGDPQDWEIPYGVKKHPDIITGWIPKVAESMFLWRFAELTKQGD